MAGSRSQGAATEKPQHGCSSDSSVKDDRGSPNEFSHVWTL